MNSNSFVQNTTRRVVRYIRPVPPGETEGLVASIYRQAEKEFVLVPLITHSQAPEILAGVRTLTREDFVVGRAGRFDRKLVAARRLTLASQQMH